VGEVWPPALLKLRSPCRPSAVATDTVRHATAACASLCITASLCFGAVDSLLSAVPEGHLNGVTEHHASQSF